MNGNVTDNSSATSSISGLTGDAMDKTKIIEAKAKALHQHLKTDIRYDLNFLPRPFFVEITGTPDSGKSTIIEQLYDTLRKEKLRVYKPLEGAQEIQHISRDTPLYNLRTGQYALEMLIDFSQGHQYDIVIFERCAFDMHVWMEDWYALGKLCEAERNIYQHFALSRFWTNNIDAAFFVVCEPETAMKRALSTSPTQKVGGTTNLEKIKVLVEKYRSAFNKLARHYPQLKLVDTTQLRKKKMVELFTMEVLNMLEAKTKNPP